MMFKIVALLTESVDWNQQFNAQYTPFFGRSPHGERGLKLSSPKVVVAMILSLSSRRAWIEITGLSKLKKLAKVALLTESVDWNCKR